MRAGRWPTASSTGARTRGSACSATTAAARCWWATCWRRAAWVRPAARRVTVDDHVPDAAALQQVVDDPNCFTFQELFPGGFVPQQRGAVVDASLVGGLRGSTGRGIEWGPERLPWGRTEPNSSRMERSTHRWGWRLPLRSTSAATRQRDVNVTFDVSHAVAERVNIAAGAEWRDERFSRHQGDQAGWAIGSYAGAGLHGRLQRHVRLRPAADRLLESRQRRGLRRSRADRHRRRVDAGRSGPHRELQGLRDDDERQVVGPYRLRAGQREHRVPRADPRPATRREHPELVRPRLGRSGQQRGHPIGVAGRPGCGAESRWLPSSRSTTPPAWCSTPVPSRSHADYFHIDVSDRIGITSNFVLTPAESAQVVAEGFEAARSVRNYRFFTNAFSTASRGIDVVSIYVPLALRGNTVVSAVFNYTDTGVTDNAKGLLAGRRLAEYAYALPRTPLERRGDPTHRPGEPARTGQLLRRLVRLRQRIRRGLRTPRVAWPRVSSTGGRSRTWS